MTRHRPGRDALASWHRDLDPSLLGGSLYAVDADDRVAAAQLLHASGCSVHSDLIIDEAGQSVGVELDDIVRVRAALPDARIDLHLIVLAEAPNVAVRLAVGEVLRVAVEIRAAWVTAADDIRSACADDFATLRREGIPVWTEIVPSDDRTAVDADGALVMFIRPGSTDKADPRMLEKIPILAQRTRVGVDGGITAGLARASVDAGASYIVSGRALLHGPPPQSASATPSHHHDSSTITKEDDS